MLSVSPKVRNTQEGKVTIKANHQKVHDRSVAGYIVECKPKVTGQ